MEYKTLRRTLLNHNMACGKVCSLFLTNFFSAYMHGLHSFIFIHDAMKHGAFCIRFGRLHMLKLCKI